MKTKQWAKKLFRSASSKSSSNTSTAMPSISTTTTSKSLNPKSTSSSLSSQFYSHSTSSVSSVLTVKKQSIRKIFCHVDGNGSVNSIMSLTFKTNNEQNVRSDPLHYDVNSSATTSSSPKNELVIPASSQEQLTTTTLYYYPPPNENEMDFVPKPKFHQEHLCQKEKETLTKSKKDITMMGQFSTSESGTQCLGQTRQPEPSSTHQMPPKIMSHISALSSEKHTKIPQGPHYHCHQHQQAPTLPPGDTGVDPSLGHYYLSDANRAPKASIDIMDKSTASSLTLSNSGCDRANSDCTCQVLLRSDESLCCSFEATSQHAIEKASCERLAKAVDNLSGVVEDLSRKIVMIMNDSDDTTPLPRNHDGCCSNLPLLSAPTPSLPDISNGASRSGLCISFPNHHHSLSNTGRTRPSISEAPMDDDNKIRSSALTRSKSLCASRRVPTPPPQRPLQRPPQSSRASPPPLLLLKEMEVGHSCGSRPLCSSPLVGTVCGPDELAVPTALHYNTSTALDYTIQCGNLDSVREDFIDDSIRTVPTKSVMRSRSCIGFEAARSLGYESQANRGHGTRRNLEVLNAGPSGHSNVAPSMSQDRGGLSEATGCSALYTEISRQNALTPTPTPTPLRPARPDEDLCHVLKHIELDIARFEWPELFMRGITDSEVGDHAMRI